MAVRAVTSLAELQQLAARARPQQALAGDRVLAVREDLAPLLPLGGLRRGTVAGVDSRALLHALLAGPSQAGSWVGLVGLGSLGLAAAIEAGVVAERTVVVDTGTATGTATGTVPVSRAPASGAVAGAVLVDAVAALIDALDVVVLGPRVVLAATACRRLEARARERGAVVLVEGRRTWPAATDLDLRVLSRRPVGLGAGPVSGPAGGPVSGPAGGPVGGGHGHLHGIRAEVEVTGRGAAARPRRGEVWLQGGPLGPFAEDGLEQPGVGREQIGREQIGTVPMGVGLRAVG